MRLVEQDLRKARGDARAFQERGYLGNRLQGSGMKPLN